MRVTLLRPFVDSTVGVSPPLSLMYLSAYLKSKNIDARIVDHCEERGAMANPDPSRPNVAKVLDRIRECAPDMIGMTLFSRELKDIADFCRLLKRAFPAVPIVLGGPHPTAMPQQSLEQIPDCDLLVRGEGERVLYELVQCLSAKGALRGVRGISYREGGGQIVHAPDADVIADLDTIPFPDRDGVLAQYRARTYGSFIYGTPSDIVMTSRGCPFQCHFCFKVCSTYRARSAENVLREVDWVVNNVKPVSIQFMDDSFTISKPRAHAILDGLVQRSYRVTYKVRSRVSAVDESLLQKMRRAGVDTIVYGLESGAQSMLDAFGKKTTVEQNMQACRLARKVGLSCLGDMILFYPGETRETLAETERFVRQARPTGVKFYVLTPLPRTRVYDEAKASGTLVGDWAIGQETPWVRLDGFDGLAEMEGIARRMYLRALLRPSSIIGLLVAYGKSFLGNPGLTVRMALANVLKKRKY